MPGQKCTVVAKGSHIDNPTDEIRFCQWARDRLTVAMVTNGNMFLKHSHHNQLCFKALKIRPGFGFGSRRSSFFLLDWNSGQDPMKFAYHIFSFSFHKRSFGVLLCIGNWFCLHVKSFAGLSPVNYMVTDNSSAWTSFNQIYSFRTHFHMEDYMVLKFPRRIGLDCRFI